MAKKIVFELEVEKVEAIAAEKAAHPEPTAHQAKHLADLEAAVVSEVLYTGPQVWQCRKCGFREVEKTV